jgi:hypothetical protein
MSLVQEMLHGEPTASPTESLPGNKPLLGEFPGSFFVPIPRQNYLAFLLPR